jgi:hypothetical protein
MQVAPADHRAKRYPVEDEPMRWRSCRPHPAWAGGECQEGIDNDEVIETVHARRAPMIPVSATLRLFTTPER